MTFSDKVISYLASVVHSVIRHDFLSESHTELCIHLTCLSRYDIAEKCHTELPWKAILEISVWLFLRKSYRLLKTHMTYQLNVIPSFHLLHNTHSHIHLCHCSKLRFFQVFVINLLVTTYFKPKTLACYYLITILVELLPKFWIFETQFTEFDWVRAI